MNYVFIINSFSLKKETNKIKDKLINACEKLNLNYEIEINSNSNPTEKIVKKYHDSHSIIVCIGGDGTINRTLNSIIGTSNVLGYVPLGTGNDFYKTNRETLKNGINEVDLIKINNKYFLNTACFGIDADIGSEEIVHSSVIPKSQRYSLAAIKNIVKFKGKKLKIYINGKEYKDDYTTIVIANGKYYGGGFMVAPSALLDDGIVEVYLAKKMPKLRMIKLFKDLKNGNHENDKYVTKIRTNEVRIESLNETECLIDGEVLKNKKFNVKVIPKGIKIFYDENLIGELLK